MRNKDVEKRIKNAVRSYSRNNFDNILRQCDKQKGDVIIMKKRNNLKKILSVAAALIVLVAVVMVGAGIYNNNTAVTYIGLDVNPSLQLKVNSADKVVDVVALNDDARELLAGLDLKGTDTNVALHAVIGALVKNGHLNDRSNSVLVSVDGKDALTVEKSVMAKLDELLAATELGGGAVIGVVVADDDDQAEILANKHGISEGKAELILAIVKRNPEMLADQLATLSINELSVLLSSNKVDNSAVDKSGSASTDAYISREAALKVALDHASLTREQVTDLEVELDLKGGVMVYDVDYDFRGMDYEHIINATTGQIVRCKHKQHDDDSHTQLKPAFTAQEARDIALAHAKVELANARDLDVELDRKNGLDVYEVEFEAGGLEYEYRINAQTKEIITSKYKGEHKTESTQKVISVQQAKDAALAHAGVDPATVVGYFSELDNEDGRQVYDIEFYCDGYEYDYEIDAVSGDILKHEKEAERKHASSAAPEQTPSQSTQGRISVQDARDKALAHAGLTSADIKGFECELDRENGKEVYEIEFRNGSFEYDYEVDAQTGEILKSEKEIDD